MIKESSDVYGGAYYSLSLDNDDNPDGMWEDVDNIAMMTIIQQYIVDTDGGAIVMITGWPRNRIRIELE